MAEAYINNVTDVAIVVLMYYNNTAKGAKYLG